MLSGSFQCTKEIEEDEISQDEKSDSEECDKDEKAFKLTVYGL